LPLNIHDIDGPLRVLAGPGTGKTHALVDLYEQAVREGVAGRGRILVLTFSTGAAAELARRIDERLQKLWNVDIHVPQLLLTPASRAFA